MLLLGALALAAAAEAGGDGGPGTPADSAAAGPTVLVAFLPGARPEGDTVRLGDIARLRGPDPAVRDLAAWPVARNAGFGRGRDLDLDPLRSRLLAAAEGRYRLHWTGAVLPRVRLERPGHALPADSLRGAVDAFVGALPSGDGSWTWEFAGKPPDIVVPNGAYRLRVEPLPGRRAGRKPLALCVLDGAGSKALRREEVAVDLRLWAEVCVAKAKLGRDEIVPAGKVALERREIGTLVEAPLRSPALAVGARSREVIMPGRVLTARMLAVAPLVRRGQAAKLVVAQGAFRVTAEAVCRQDGIGGQVIYVQNLATGKLQRARVRPDATLEPVPAWEGG